MNSRKGNGRKGAIEHADTDRSVVEDRIAELLERGCSLVMALVSPTGEPYVTRGWGLTPIAAASGQFRVLMAAEDAAFVGAREKWAIAVTLGDPRTAAALQLKGRAGPLLPTEDVDQVATARYCDTFFHAVLEGDGRPGSLLERMRPADLVAFTLAVDEVFDQTPGPAAGSFLGGQAP